MPSAPASPPFPPPTAASSKFAAAGSSGAVSWRTSPSASPGSAPPSAAARLCSLALQLGVVFLHELPNLVSEVEQPLPLLDVEGDGHPLQAVDADGPLLADLAVQRPLLGLLRLLQELGRLPDRDFAGGDH